MEKVNSKIQLYIKLPIFLAILISLVVISGSYENISFYDVLYQLPKAIAVYAVGSFVFSRWLWKSSIFKDWLVKVPNIQGTWKGFLKSDWINPETQQGIDEIPVFLVVKQSFNKIECSILTKESSSHSLSADIDDIHGNLQLSYTYTNTPKTTHRDRSEIHNGAALLKIINDPKRKLSGEYWTDRKTRGEMNLEFLSNKLIQEFSSQ